MKKSLFLYYAVGIFLFATYHLWPYLDAKFFTFTNEHLRLHPNGQLFWALANHRLVDWMEDIAILIFYILAVKAVPPNEKKKRLIELLVSALFIALVIICINRLLCRDLLRLRRDSPTIAFPNAFRLSEVLPWIGIKDISAKSFPGDHATTALLFGISYLTIVGKKLGLPALILAIFLSLPRLMTGAHWLSDIVVGSGMIICFTWGLAIGTPLFHMGTRKIEKMFQNIPLWYKKPL